MPRDIFSNYTLPAGNPVVTGTIISTTWANTTLNDIATALTQSLSTDGSTASVSLLNKTLNGGTLASNTITSPTVTGGSFNAPAVTGGTFASPTVSGVMDLQGGRITFPAVQVSSGNVNTLDDYEEGAFTPTLTFAVPGNLTVTYNTRIGQYTKIGDTVHVSIRIATATFNHSTASGAFKITGLPAAALSLASYTQGVHVTEFSGVAVAASRTQVTAQILPATTELTFTTLNLQTGGAFNVDTSEAISASQKTIILDITYKAAS